MFAKSDTGTKRKSKVAFDFIEIINQNYRKRNKDSSRKFFFLHGRIVVYVHMCECTVVALHRDAEARLGCLSQSISLPYFLRHSLALKFRALAGLAGQPSAYLMPLYQGFRHG